MILHKQITSTCWVPCPLGLLRCRDWIDRLRCLTSKSGLAARAADADLFQGLKCPWHGVILPAQARMLSKMGFLLTYFGCRVVQSIANSRLWGSFWAVSLWFLSLQTLLVVGSYVVLLTISGKKSDSPRPTSRIGMPSKSWWHRQKNTATTSTHRWKRPTVTPPPSIRTWLFFGERSQALSEPPLPGAHQHHLWWDFTVKMMGLRYEMED